MGLVVGRMLIVLVGCELILMLMSWVGVFGRDYVSGMEWDWLGWSVDLVRGLWVFVRAGVARLGRVIG